MQQREAFRSVCWGFRGRPAAAQWPPAAHTAAPRSRITHPPATQQAGQQAAQKASQPPSKPASQPAEAAEHLHGPYAEHDAAHGPVCGSRTARAATAGHRLSCPPSAAACAGAGPGLRCTSAGGGLEVTGLGWGLQVRRLRSAALGVARLQCLGVAGLALQGLRSAAGPGFGMQGCEFRGWALLVAVSGGEGRCRVGGLTRWGSGGLGTQG